MSDGGPGRSRLTQALACGAIIGLSVFSLDQIVGGYLLFSLVYSLVCVALAVPVAYVWLGRVESGAPASKSADAGVVGLLVALVVFAVALGYDAGTVAALGYALIGGVLATMIRYLLLGRRERRAR